MVATRSDPGRDALFVFLAAAAVMLLGILVSMRLRPDWFGLQSVGAHVQSGVHPGTDRGEALGGTAPEEPDALSPEAVFQSTRVSVVRVTTRSGVPFEALMDGAVLRGENGGQAPTGIGSGVVWDAEGHIVTSTEVLENATSATVTLWSDEGEQQFSARLVGRDGASGIAVIRIDAPEGVLRPIPVGESRQLVVGSPVLAVACPFGIDPSLSIGNISGLERRVRSRSGGTIDGALQSDAAFFTGSSGGALLNSMGRAVGIQIPVLSGRVPSSGFSFALPMVDVLRVVPDIIEGGFLWHPRQGLVTLADADSADLIRRAGQNPAIRLPAAGVVIAEIVPGSPAERAGMRGLLSKTSASGAQEYVLRDIIVRINGDDVATRGEVLSALELHGDSDRLRVTVARPHGPVDLILER